MTGEFLSQSCSQLLKIKISVNKINQYTDDGEHYLLTKILFATYDQNFDTPAWGPFLKGPEKL